MSRIHLQVLLALVALPTTGALATAQNPIYSALVDRGVAVAPQETIKLPKPALGDGLSPAAQRQAIEALLGDRYDWDSFTRKADVSPIMLKIADEPAGGQVGRRVDLSFVAYGSFDKLNSDNYLTDQLNITAADSEKNGNGRATTKLLSNDELGKRNLPIPQKSDDARWIATTANLLDKVSISATTKNVKSQTADSTLIASALDPAFDTDAKYPNSWHSLATDDAGERQAGSPQPYAGLGSYVKATRLAEPAGAIFFEYHVVFAEPKDWFHGANLLRSKLPIVAQDMVRKFRRGLK